MRFRSLCRLSFLALTITTLFSCNEKETFSLEPLSDFAPLTVGKYITYRADSLVFKSFGRVTEIHKYQVKHIVDAEITDNQGNKSYRVHTFIRDSTDLNSWTAAQPWVSSNTYNITPFSDRIEVIEDNLRVIKLRQPIREGYSWKGNSYLSDQPYEAAGYSFSNDDAMDDWDFTYEAVLPFFSYKGKTYTDVLSVEQVDEAFNAPVTIPTSYGAKSRSVDRYAKNIGLVYREFEMWEYQPNTGGSGGPYKNGFGITMWMIDHN